MFYLLRQTHELPAAAVVWRATEVLRCCLVHHVRLCPCLHMHRLTATLWIVLSFFVLLCF